MVAEMGGGGSYWVRRERGHYDGKAAKMGQGITDTKGKEIDMGKKITSSGLRKKTERAGQVPRKLVIPGGRSATG